MITASVADGSVGAAKDAAPELISDYHITEFENVNEKVKG